jgi:hypothetical protein
LARLAAHSASWRARLVTWVSDTRSMSWWKGSGLPFRRQRLARRLGSVDWLHWLLYCALPAIAIALLFVGAFGPRLMAVAFALAVMAPLVLLRSVPVWPWSLPLHAVPPADWLVWGIAAAGLVGLGHDLRLWPQPLGGPPMVLAGVGRTVAVVGQGAGRLEL